MNQIKNRYIKVKDISQGSQGIITLMKDTEDNNKYVVLKTIKPPEESQIDFEKSLNEVNLLKQLHHPNVIQYYDSIYEPPNSLYIFLEYADCQDLSKYMQKNKKMSNDQILRIFSQIILGLSYIHSKKIIHRDLKCENIFLFKNELVKIGDFGVSKEISDGKLAHTVIGSPLFFAPEILLNMPYSYPADIWAAGCILYQMMTSRHPFLSKSSQELIGKVLCSKPSIPSGCDKRLADLFFRMVDKEPKNRPTASEILQIPMIKKQLSAIQSFIDLKKKSSNNKRSSSKNQSINLSPDYDNDIQLDVPEWIKENQTVADELQIQSNRQLEEDTTNFAQMIKKSFANNSHQNELLIMMSSDLALRKEKLVQLCKEKMKDKYSIVYEFVKKNGIDNRNELCNILNTVSLPEESLKMIETITMIERFI